MRFNDGHEEERLRSRQKSVSHDDRKPQRELTSVQTFCTTAGSEDCPSEPATHDELSSPDHSFTTVSPTLIAPLIFVSPSPPSVFFSPALSAGIVITSAILYHGEGGKDGRVLRAADPLI